MPSLHRLGANPVLHTTEMPHNSKPIWAFVLIGMGDIIVEVEVTANKNQIGIPNWEVERSILGVVLNGGKIRQATPDSSSSSLGRSYIVGNVSRGGRADQIEEVVELEQPY